MRDVDQLAKMLGFMDRHRGDFTATRDDETVVAVIRAELGLDNHEATGLLFLWRQTFIPGLSLIDRAGVAIAGATGLP